MKEREAPHVTLTKKEVEYAGDPMALSAQDDSQADAVAATEAVNGPGEASSVSGVSADDTAAAMFEALATESEQGPANVESANTPACAKPDQVSATCSGAGRKEACRDAFTFTFTFTFTCIVPFQWVRLAPLFRFNSV